MTTSTMTTSTSTSTMVDETPPPLPVHTYAAFAPRLLPHQRAGVEWMLAREAPGAVLTRGGVLADTVGLGKTWTTLGLLVACQAQPAPTLLVLPTLLINQWCSALRSAHLTPRLLSRNARSVSGYRGWERLWDGTGTSSDDVYITTYGRAARAAQGDAVARQLSAALHPPGGWGRLVLDEGHVLRNGHATRAFQTLAALPGATQARWVLSGTPVQSGARDWAHLLEFLRVRTADVIAAGGAAVAAKTLMLRRTVEDVTASLPPHMRLPPPPTHEVVPVAFSDATEAAVFANLAATVRECAVECARARAAASNNPEDDHVARAAQQVALVAYTRTRQFLAHPVIYDAGMALAYGDAWTRRKARWSGSGARLDALDRLLRATTPRHTLVFASFVQEVELAAEVARGAGFATWTVIGGMSRAALGAVLSSASATAAADASVMPVAVILQIDAGAAGLNLQFASRVIFLGSTWNPSVQEQAIARAHRLGQRERVTVVSLLLSDGGDANLDRLMLQAQAVKRAAADAIAPGLLSALDPALSAHAGIVNNEDSDGDDDDDDDGDGENA